MWDPTAHKMIISRDVIYTKDKVQEKEINITSKEKPETITIQVEDKQEQKVLDSSEAVPEHEKQVQAELRENRTNLALVFYFREKCCILFINSGWRAINIL